MDLLLRPQPLSERSDKALEAAPVVRRSERLDALEPLVQQVLGLEQLISVLEAYQDADLLLVDLVSEGAVVFVSVGEELFDHLEGQEGQEEVEYEEGGGRPGWSGGRPGGRGQEGQEGQEEDEEGAGGGRRGGLGCILSGVRSESLFFFSVPRCRRRPRRW